MESGVTIIQNAFVNLRGKKKVINHKVSQRKKSAVFHGLVSNSSYFCNPKTKKDE